MSTFKDKLKTARRPERIVPICLRGDLLGTFEDLERQLQVLEQVDDLEDGRAVAIAGQIEAIRSEMAESTHQFRLRALPGPAYRELKAKYPPRMDTDESGAFLHPADIKLDVNVDEMTGPLLRASLVDPDVTSDADWAEVDAALNDGQYERLVVAALNVNRGTVDIPFSQAASNALRSTAPA